MTAGVLDGVRVIDFTHIFSGPLTTQILGDLGADVIKVERIGGGDAARSYGQGPGEPSMGGSFLALNRNKRSIAVDMSNPEGIEVVKSLIATADVVVQNFRVGQMERWGLDYASLAEQYPALIYCSISGFGDSGPLRDRAANDLVIQAYSGLMSFTGEPDGDPVRCGTAIADLSAGTFAAMGVLAAYIHRLKSGEGQEVSTSMLESQVGMMNYFFADYWLKGIVPRPLGTANRLGIPNQAFPTSDGWVVISNANEPMFARCCEALGIPEVATDSRFRTLGDRYQHTKELVDTFSAATSAMTTAEALSALEKQRVSCGPINDVPTVAADPQLAATDTFIDVERGDGGSARVVATPMRLSRTPRSVRRGVPVVGQHSEELLRELGLADEAIAGLMRDHIIAEPSV